MTRWRPRPDLRMRMVAAKAFALRDDFTAAPPFGPLPFVLEELRGPPSGWVEVAIPPLRAAGLLAFAGLGLAVDPAATPLRRFRLRYVDDPPRAIYRAAFRFTLDALEFDVPTYNHATPPAGLPGAPDDLFLYPGAAYPFPRHLTVLRGTVRDAAGAVVDVRVAANDKDRVLTDERGAFSLPLRISQPANAVILTCDHGRTNRSFNVTVALPAGALDLAFP